MDQDFNANPLYVDPGQQVYNPLNADESVVAISDPLALDIDDKELLKIAKKKEEDDVRFYEEKYNLTERRRKNERYLFSRQVGEQEKKGQLKDYETRSADNVLYEIENSLKSVALSKLPDIMITPGGEDPQRIMSAKDLTKVIDDPNAKREQRGVAELGFKHLPVYFTAVVKARWNPEKGKQGDVEFINVNPEYVIADHTATSKNPDDMDHIIQIVPITVQELVMKFPKKKKELFEELQRRGICVGEEPTWKEMQSEVKMREIWFDWYKKKSQAELQDKEAMQLGSILEPGIKWEKISGVMWKYGDVLLEKMLDPNFDHEGEEKLFVYDVPGDETSKREIDPRELLMAQLMGQPVPEAVTEKIYHNYFQRPHKPYYFFGYDQWGKIPYDETSRIEQNIRNQENLDDQNKTILDQLKTRIKHIWGGESGLRKADIQRLDMDNPKMDVRVEGDPNKVHKAIQPERPDQAQYQAIGSTRDRMYAISGTTAIRGALQSDVATSNQIARENNFATSDNLTENTINSIYEWFAMWRMQFIKLRYTNEHMVEILGTKGDTTYIRLRRDSISDGMEVRIKSSSTDKLKAQRNAMDTAGLGPPYTNPLDFFRDMDMSDPEGRTERGIMFATDPAGYFAKYIMGLENTQQMGAALNGAPPAAPSTPNPAVSDAPAGPTPVDTTQVPATPTAPPQPMM